jgi:hypothetical protein
MARRKGSKNRTTLERELSEAGVKGDLSQVPYEELVSKAEAAPKPPAPPPVREAPERSIIDPTEAQAIIDDTRRRFNAMVDYYTSDEDVGLTGEESFIPERIQEFLRLKVFMASSVEEARQVARKALSKLHIHLLVLWTSKRITGPSTAENIQKRAAKAEKWAARLDKLGRHDEARRQRERVEAIRATATTGSGSPWVS